MKKLFPLNFIMFLTLFGIGVFFIPEMNVLIAKKSSVENKIHAHYEAKLAKLNLETFISKKKIKGRDLQEGIVILNFWASWCRPCLEEFPSLVKLRKKFSDKEVRIIAINSDEEDINKNVSKIIKKYHINFDVVLDDAGLITDAFNISAIPVSIIYRDGKVIEVSNGAKDFYSIEFQERIKSLLIKKSE